MKRISLALLSLLLLSFSSYSQPWKQYFDSAQALEKQNKQDQAIEYYSKAREQLKKDSMLTATYATSCHRLGDLYRRSGQHEKAEALIQESKQTREKVLGREHPDYAASCNGLGTLYAEMGQYEKAEPLHLEAKEIRERVLGGEHPDYASSCNNLGNLYLALGQYEKAEPLHLEAKEIRERVLGGEHPDYAQSCNSLAALYWRMGQYEKAEPLYLKARQIREKVLSREHPDYAQSCNNLGALYVGMGQYEKAEPLYLEAMQIWKKLKGKEHPDYAGSCNNLGALYMDMGQYEKAEPFYLEAKQIREKVLGKKHPDYATSLNNLAILYCDMGRYEKAEPLYLEAKQIREKVLGKQHPDYADNCNSLAVLYQNKGQNEKAETLFLEAKQIREKVLGKEHPYYAQSCSNLGSLYDDMGEYQKAEPLYLEAKQIREKVLGKQHPDYASNCNSLGVLYDNMGQYEKAEHLYLEARQIWQNLLGKQNLEYAASCINLGVVYKNMAQYEKVEPLILEARQITEKVLGKEHRIYAQSCSNLGTLYSDIGQSEKAEHLYLEARQIMEKVLGREHPDYAEICNNLGALYIDMGKYEKAESLFLEAMQIRVKVLGREHPDYAWNCANLGNIYRILHQPDKALAFYKEACQSKKLQIRKIFQFTSEAEQQAYLKTFEDFNAKFLSFSTTLPASASQNFAYDAVLSRRNLILTSAQQLRKAVLNDRDSTMKYKYKEWIDTRKQLAFWYSKPLSEKVGYIDSLEAKSNNLEKELSRLSAAFRNQQQQKEITCKRIQQSLKPNEAAIEFAAFQYTNGKKDTDSTFYIALVLRKDGEPQLVPLFEQKQLEETLKQAGVHSSQNINALYASLSLYNLIWQPLEHHLKSINKVYFAPAGLLHRISLAALPVSTKETLSDRYQLVRLTTTASVINQSPYYVNASDKMQLYGGVQFDADSLSLKRATKRYHSESVASRSLDSTYMRGGHGWTYLAGTEEEVSVIKKTGKQKHLSLTVLQGTNATEESIKALSGKASPSVLHIATHGFFFPDPKEEKQESRSDAFGGGGKPFRQSDNPLFRSGLLFAGANNTWEGNAVAGLEDGILTSYEVSNLYLPNTKLAVLSACETGLGDIGGNEGVYGLQRAFKTAGVENLVMSLWKVPDAATTEFMQAFYQSLFTRQSIYRAFYQAQTAMKNKYRDEPYKWAAWVLVR